MFQFCNHIDVEPLKCMEQLPVLVNNDVTFHWTGDCGHSYIFQLVPVSDLYGCRQYKCGLEGCGFETYSSKDKSVIVNEQGIMLDSSSSYGEIIYRFDVKEEMLFNHFVSIDNNSMHDSDYNISYYLRFSDDNRNFTDWIFTKYISDFNYKSRYVEVKIVLEKQFGGEVPEIHGFLMFYGIGKYNHIIANNNGYFSFKYHLNSDERYIYRIRVYDGVSWSAWTSIGVIEPVDNGIDNLSLSYDFVWEYFSERLLKKNGK